MSRLQERSIALAAAVALAACASRQESDRLYLDVHHLDPAAVSVAGVAEAHQQDLALQAAHGVRYERYWVDEHSGTVYCLAHAPSAEAAAEVHRLGHGLVADEIHEVQPGILPAPATGRRLFMDTHRMGPGVRAEDVAEAHRKDLATQARRGVSFLEYWVDESSGVIHCLAEAPEAQAMAETHREAHGLVPDEIVEVVAGQE